MFSNQSDKTVIISTNCFYVFVHCHVSPQLPSQEDMCLTLLRVLGPEAVLRCE